MRIEKHCLICTTQKIHLLSFNILKIYLKKSKNKNDNGIQKTLEYSKKKYENDTSAKSQGSSGPF